tara:strand:+ start:715 stop:1158 length:444 start_codon:yes stop_codon:yes gene_type:complete
MKIILKENIERLGFKDEIIKVKPGYARNYLIPKGLGILATDSAVKILNENLKQRSKKESEEIDNANKLSDLLSKAKINIKAKVAEGGVKLFGSIKKSDIAESLSKEGLSVDAKFIKIGSIKELGTYEAEIRLHREVSVVISFNVVKE